MRTTLSVLPFAALLAYAADTGGGTAGAKKRGTTGAEDAPKDVETGVARERAMSLNMGDPTESPKLKTSEDRGYSSEPGSEEGGEDDPEGDDDADEGEEKTEGEDEEKAEGDTTAEDDLPEYSEETKAVYEKRFKTADGKFNEAALTENFQQNAAKGTEDLSPGVYKMLAEAGWSEDFVKDIVSARKAQAQVILTTVVANAGGTERVEQAIAWAKAGGYTPEQRARFNAAMASGDPAAMQDAVDLAISRQNLARYKDRRNRREAPERQVRGEAGGEGSGAKGYATRDEWSKANREAQRSNDPAKMAEVRRRYRASQWNKPTSGKR